MSWHPHLLKGLAQTLHEAGLGIYRETGAFDPSERGIVTQAYPEIPNEIIAISLYLPGSAKFSPTAAHEFKTPRVQIRYRLAGHPFEGLEVFDQLHALIDRQHLQLGQIRVVGRYVSFGALGQDRNNRYEFTSNWELGGLAHL